MTLHNFQSSGKYLHKKMFALARTRARVCVCIMTGPTFWMMN